MKGLWTAFPLSLLLFAAACGSSPKTEFFALQPIPSDRPAQPVSGPHLTVNAVHLPPTLDRLELVTFGKGGTVEVSPTHRWAAPLDQMARTVLARDLTERLPPGTVVSPDAAQATGRARGLIVDLREFGTDAAGRVTLEGDWTLVAAKGKNAALHQHERIIEESGVGNQAMSMSRALAELADHIAGALAQADGAAP